jgi:anti-anti-sigma regulatory factor
MWKVKRIEDGKQIILTFSGRLEGEQLNELEDVFASGAIQNLILDLDDVKIVDQSTVRFLTDCEASGATLRNCPAYIREWISAHRATSETTLNEK